MAARFLYRYIFKRTSTFILGIVVASMCFERAYDHGCESIFEWINEGRLWMHIKDQYEDQSQQLNYKHNLIKKEISNLHRESNKRTKED
ncbi:cytochrome b-c1 complex subunit 9 [Colletes gigas]|uniref:cytochrome b-c1 complex subunit 9 n=1 Tax=Colletes gigas TaxID=935657 RepID=UPI001C9AF096|nr:cytochrome b-c1 complex subunit 9 [Colletes gigas]